jgi:hypothetical protein
MALVTEMEKEGGGEALLLGHKREGKRCLSE